MSFTVLLHPRAAKSLKRLPPSTRIRLLDRLKELQDKPGGGDQLRPSKFWRVRVGDYRAIYEIDRRTSRATVFHVGHQKKVYDEFSRLV